jgi:hypothetical protein
MKQNQYTEEHGLYDDYMGKHPDAIVTVDVPVSESKIVKHHEGIKSKATMAKHVCACGNDSAFRIFGKGYSIIAQCSVCSNEKVISEA